MAITHINLTLLFLLPLLSIALCKYPPSCNSIECPNYHLIQEADGFEIRRYNSTLWMSTSPIQEISYENASRIGFFQLYNYISGKNDANKKIEMTCPVLIDVTPSTGPLCKSSFEVSFYVPKAVQPNAPTAKGLHAQKWGPSYVAVRQFGGFADDSNIGKEAAALKASLDGSKWAAAVQKSRASKKSAYIVAGYNAPFEYKDRVNEIWLTFDMARHGHSM
ncbi:hypothetical protein V2J09_012858 [Rumex salicifolius]